MAKGGLILYEQQYEAIRDLSLMDKGLLLDVVFQYHMNGIIPQNLPPMVKMAFSFIRTSIDIDKDKYLKKCAQNRENAAKRWDTENADAFDGMQSDATDANNNTNNYKLITDTNKNKTLTNISNDESKDSQDTNSLDFDNVWELYQKKGNKKTSFSKWNKLSVSKKKLALSHIPEYVQATPDKKFRKNFETYINQEAWNDELPDYLQKTDPTKLYPVSTEEEQELLNKFM